MASEKQPGWKEIPAGGVIAEAGNAIHYKTGDWRSERPVLDKKACINCLQCWVFCPDGSIMVRDEQMSGFDYDHCKGCGICAHTCPVKAIEMISEDGAGSVETDEWGIRRQETEEAAKQ